SAVVARGHSGSLESMDDATAYLVDYDLVPVGPGSEPYPPDSRWAQPSVDHAAELMRRVVDRPEGAREGIQGSWRKFFMDGWRERRRRRADLPPGTLDWLPDGTPIDPTTRGLLAED